MQLDHALPRIAMHDFRAQWRHLGAKVHESVERVGRSGWYILGSEVSGFESDLATWWGVAHAVGCASGMDAIELGLRTVGVRPGDQVLTTPLSAFATTLAILRCGSSPVFVDTDALGLMNLDAAQEALSADSHIRCVLPVHLYGHALDLERLERLKKTYGVRVIEDCAQAIGASWKGRPVGTVGDAAALSFYPTKNLGCLGDGGAVLTADPEIARQARALRDYGQTAKYSHTELGLNSRLDELQAAILAHAFLPELNGWTARRRQIAATYRERIAHPGVVLPPVPAGSHSVWHIFPLVVPVDRASLSAHLLAKGITSAIHYPKLIPCQDALAGAEKRLFRILGSLERSGALVREELSIPIHPYLSDTEVDEVIDGVNTWS